MLKRPSSRRKPGNGQIQLNLVPILDTMVTLIGFLLFTTSFLSIVAIETPFPMASPAENQEKLKERPLQLTLTVRDKEVEIWSPFEKIKAITIPNPTPGQPDLPKVHEALVGVKQQFPNETKIVFVPTKDTNYDTLIQLMDGIRGMEKTDPPMFAKDARTGTDVPVKLLFPEVIFGNLLGET